MSGTTVPAAEVAALISGVKQLFATSFIGFSVATTIYGISVLQVYLYYRNYPEDRAPLKFIVALLFLLDTLSTIFVAHSLYTFYVLNFGKNPVEDLVIPWSFSVDGETPRHSYHICGPDVNSILVFVPPFANIFTILGFYARTIWKVTVSKAVAGFIIFLAIVCLALGIVTTVDLWDPSLHIDWNPEILGSLPRTILPGSSQNSQIISGLVQGLAALNDVIITASMCYYLHRNRSPLPSTGQFVDTLILYAVSRGVLTAVCQILFLVTNVALPGATYWQPFHQAVGKLYVNSVYATLNVRSTFQQKSEVQLGTAPIFKVTQDGTPASGQISVESSRYPQPITFAPTRATDTTGTNSSALNTSSGFGEKA
ncbi:hypothetical protein DFH07DRAFT_952558 [Mycena maculata]|uniref:DUF6534 domain-containing protein n=1 Tax=Mycena maculata TaxID=230809 RepID=A0AAD7K2C5_9AGAR|nr:hypothetical protein DFH07DRAFT_952558 [Mycena maculata]